MPGNDQKVDGPFLFTGMAKRFTDTDKYKKPFIRGLPGPYKLLWDYLYHDCDHAGIWIVDFDIAQIYIGNDMPVNKEDALKYFNSGEKRIVVLSDGAKWFLPSFIDFQYGELNSQNRAHNSVITILSKYNLFDSNKGLIRPLQGAKVKDKDKDMVKVKAEPAYKKFYREQWELTKGHTMASKYQHIVKYIMNMDKNVVDEPGLHILNLKKQLSFEQFVTLQNYCEKRATSIKEMVDSWLNKPSYSTGRVSVYAVLNKWAGKAAIQGTNFQDKNTPLIKTNIGKS